ncbi:MAG TPA: MauE/DoxX family redox-associated membrane protein, partial [Thermoguttaceae bacterium]
MRNLPPPAKSPLASLVQLPFVSAWKKAIVRSPLKCIGPVRSGYDVLSIVLSLVLLAAAALKTNELATGPVLGSGFLDSRWLLIVIVEFELLFGLWLLAGIYPEQTWAIALLCFGLFSCVSLFKALSGNASCGCFGSISINPWFTASFDLSVVLALLYWRPWGLVPFAHG